MKEKTKMRRIKKKIYRKVRGEREEDQRFTTEDHRDKEIKHKVNKGSQSKAIAFCPFVLLCALGGIYFALWTQCSLWWVFYLF
jgi:hypothetical protein